MLQTIITVERHRRCYALLFVTVSVNDIHTSAYFAVTDDFGNVVLSNEQRAVSLS